MSLVDAARSRWRAELHEYAAAELKDIDPQQAAEHERAMLNELHYADLMEELAAAKESGNAEKLRQTKLNINSFRRNMRSAHFPAPGIMNNFEEPSTFELIGD